MEISKAAHFWKAYRSNIRNLKTNVYICADAQMAITFRVSKWLL